MTASAPITSLTNPRVKRVVRLRKARHRREEGVLIAEGFREVQRALAAGLELLEAFACRELFGEDRGGSVVDALEAAGPVTWVGDAVLTKMAYHDKPEGVLAVFRAPRWGLGALPGGDDAFYLVAVGTEKPGNLGAMVRTAAAAGCDAVLAVGPAVDVFNPNAIRNSTGAVFTLPTAVVDDAAAAIDWLKDRGVTVAAALADGGTDCFTGDWGAGPLAVVVGPEHAGLDEAWRAAADVALTIPSPGISPGISPGTSPASASASSGGGVVDSLNASNAAAVLLFEAVRRRRGS